MMTWHTNLDAAIPTACRCETSGHRRPLRRHRLLSPLRAVRGNRSQVIRERQESTQSGRSARGLGHARSLIRHISSWGRVGGVVVLISITAEQIMTETRKLAAILASDVVGFSKLAAADEDRTLARLRALRSDLIDPTIAVHNGRVVKRTGDGSIVEFGSVVDAVRCAIEVQNSMVERNAGLPPERRIEFRVG